MPNVPVPPIKIEQWRPYLRMLARMQIETHLQAKIDPSDIVQLTMLDAHQARHQFRGSSDVELRAWLRCILARNLADGIRQFRRGKRDVGLEQSLQAALDESAAGLERCLVDGISSPDERAMRNERLLRLSHAIDALPPDQREAVTLHHLQGQSAAQIARQMARTEISVAGLLRRGLKTLRQTLRDDWTG